MSKQIENTYKWIESSKLWKISVVNPHTAEVPFFYTDDASQFIAREHTWNISKGYARCSCHGEFLSRLILNAKEGEIVEFINKDPKLVTKRNLRRATRQEIRFKSATKKKQYDIPVPGVEYKRGGWEVRIKKGYHWRYIGRFQNLYDAVCCRIRNEYLLFGENSHNYRSTLKNIPRYYLLKWLPEIYSKDNSKYIGTEIYLAHYKDTKNTPPKLLKSVANTGKKK